MEAEKVQDLKAEVFFLAVKQLVIVAFHRKKRLPPEKHLVFKLTVLKSTDKIDFSTLGQQRCRLPESV